MTVNESPWRWPTEPADPDAAEFAPGATDPPDRRQFLATLGASAALAGAAGCSRSPREAIVPYVRTPPEVTPGRPRYYASAMTLGGVATGLLVESHTGRPTKVEGNPDHPASLGATDAFAQASILTLYDPERSATVVHDGQPSTWESAIATLRGALGGKKVLDVRILTEATTSPTLAHEIGRLRATYPQARWHQFEPVGYEHRWSGIRDALGTDADAVYQLPSSGVSLRNANVILCLDSDFLNSGPGSVRYAREFADRRRVWRAAPTEADMCRLYAVGPTPCPTSAIADHRLRMPAADVALFARALAARLNVPAGPGPESDGSFPEEWLAAVTRDLERSRGASLVVAGDTQPAYVHALAHALNQSLGNVGKTVAYIPPVHVRPREDESLTRLVRGMAEGRVDLLVILGANPVFSAPADLEFARHLRRVPLRVHLGLYRDETAVRCQWHLPEAHYLESWGDARAFDGTASIIQPLIEPLYNGRSALEFVAALRGANDRGYDLVRDYWRTRWKDRAEGFDRLWFQALHQGVIEGSTYSPKNVDPPAHWWANTPHVPSGDTASMEIVFRPDPTIFDGRFANNAWLQELPKPLSKVTWDNVALVGIDTARERGLKMMVGDDGGDMTTDLVELIYRGRHVEAPVWIMPGHAEKSVTVYFGYGRSAGGQVGHGLGFNAYAIRTFDRPWFDTGLEVRKTGRRVQLATTQSHQQMYGRDLVRHGALDRYKREPHAIAARPGENGQGGRFPLPTVDATPPGSRTDPPPPSLYPEWVYAGRKWGMVIDLTVCTGCSTCVVACQAENNIPVVGKKEVSRGREMHWLRVDVYYTGDDLSRPENTFFQPVPCMHCEKAPCEVVCPVNATVHSAEGLNDMVYNRCVGTRYCSNNCPYKVRRFNFFEYADWKTEALKPLRNPDVTVRSRGVMEKCTYCVQRINTARTYAETSDRPAVANRAGTLLKPIYENELLTACQAACPTGAIVFGDLNDPTATVGRMRYGQPLSYGLLAEQLGTQPRTRYLAALRNPRTEPGAGHG